MKTQNEIKKGMRVVTREVSGVSLKTSGIVKNIHEDFCSIVDDNNDLIAVPYENIYNVYEA